MTLDEINADIALFETARNAILTRGVASYTINGRAMTLLDLKYIDQRLTELRYARDRASTGMFLGAQNQRPE